MKLSTSSRIDGAICATTERRRLGAVLEQVVHDQRAEDQAARQADQRVDAGHDLRDEALRDRRGRLLGRRPGVLERCLDRRSSSSTALSIAASTESPISSVCWIDASHGRDHDDGHQGEQAEDDQAGAESGLEPAALERSRPGA